MGDTGWSGHLKLAGAFLIYMVGQMSQSPYWNEDKIRISFGGNYNADINPDGSESGPSGFGLRAETPEEDRAGEYYGKSTAMATAALESRLDAWSKVWTHQCYLNYGLGRWWNSRTSLLQGFRPSPGWLVHGIINRNLANHDMLKVEVSGSPTLEASMPAKGKKKAITPPAVVRAETVRAHAFGGDGYYAVAPSNLNLEKDTQIELRLPISSASEIALYTLTGGPRDTNMDDKKVEVVEKKPIP